MGGLQPTSFGDFFQGGGAGGTPILVGDMGDEPPHGQRHGVFSAQSHQADYGEKSKATGGSERGVTTTGDSDGGGGV